MQDKLVRREVIDKIIWKELKNGVSMHPLFCPYTHDIICVFIQMHTMHFTLLIDVCLIC